MKKLLFILSLFISAVTTGQNLGAPIYASQNKPNNGFTVYNKSFWKDITTDWTITGMTTTKNADSSFNLPTGASNFSQFMTLNGATNTDENWDFEIQYKVPTLSGTSYSFSIGKKTTNSTYSASIAAAIDFSQSAGSGTYIKVGDGLGQTGADSIYTGFIAPLPTAGDLISEIYSQRGNVVTIYYRNLTTGIFAASPPLVCNLQAVGVTSNWNMPNTGNFCIWNHNAGPTAISSIKITSFSNPNPKILWIGDSKTVGCASNYINARFPNLCKGLGSFTVLAGTGDKTAEVLTDTTYIFAHFNPKYVILNIGRNDVSNSVSSATYEANYDAIVAAFKRHGWQVIHLLPILETGLSQTTLSSYISSTYAADPIVDPTIGWVSGTDLSADNVHPNPAGYRLIANQVKACTAIKNNNDQFEYPPFPKTDIDIPVAGGYVLPTATTSSLGGVKIDPAGSISIVGGVISTIPSPFTNNGTNIVYNGAGGIGIGRTPTFPLDVYRASASAQALVQSGLNTGAGYYQALNNSSNGLYFGSTGSTWVTSALTPANYAFIWGTSGVAGMIIQTNGTGGSAADIVVNTNGTERLRFVAATGETKVVANRFQTAKGVAVASANNLTLGGDGNTFHITGTTTINAITTANWQAGSTIKLIFDGSLTVKNNTAGGGGTAVMLLAGGTDFSATANDVLVLLYDGTSFFEQSRSVN